MTERASVFEGVQVGIESTPGVAVPALTKLLSTGMTLGLKSPSKAIQPRGSKAAVGAVKLKEWSEGTVEGDVSYNDIIYLLSALFGQPVTTVPDGATNARLHTWLPSSFRPDEPITLTVEKGSFLGAERAVNVVVNGVTMTFNLEAAALSGDVFGKGVTAGIRLSRNEQQTITINAEGGTFRIGFDGHMTGEEAAANEIQTITINADGGTFTVTFDSQTTDPLAWNISAANLQTALEGLTSIGAGNILVTEADQVYTLEFTGDLAATDVDEVTCNDTLLELGGGSGTATPDTVSDGVPPSELAWNAAASVVQSALEALPSIGSGNILVTKSELVYTLEFIGDLAQQNVEQVTTDPTNLTGGAGTAAVATTVAGTAPTELACIPVSPVSVEVYVADSLEALGDPGTKLLNLDEVVFGLSDRFTRRTTLNRSESSFKSTVEKRFNFDVSIDVGKDDQSASMLDDLRSVATRWCRIDCEEVAEIEAGFPYKLHITFPFKYQDIEEGEKDDMEVSKYPMLPIHDSDFGGCVKFEVWNGLASL